MGKMAWIGSLLLLLAVLSGCAPQDGPDKPAAVRGEIDVRGWDFERGGTVKLRGEWAFHWERLLEPGNPALDEAADFIPVPGSWKEGAASGVKLPDKGYATYALRVRTASQGTALALRIPEASTSYNLWVNGEPAAAGGVVSDSRERYKPGGSPKIVRIPADSDIINIVVQVANFDHRFGGLWRDIELGPEQSFVQRKNWSVFLQLFICGSLGFMGGYHIWLFVWRREPSSVCFGLSCLLIAMRSLVVGEHYIWELFPNADWSLVTKLEYQSYYLLVPLSVMFLRSLYPAEMPKIVVRVVSAVGFAFAAYALIAAVCGLQDEFRFPVVQRRRDSPCRVCAAAGGPAQARGRGAHPDRRVERQRDRHLGHAVLQ